MLGIATVILFRCCRGWWPSGNAATRTQQWVQPAVCQVVHRAYTPSASSLLEAACCTDLVGRSASGAFNASHQPRTAALETAALSLLLSMAQVLDCCTGTAQLCLHECSQAACCQVIQAGATERATCSSQPTARGISYRDGSTSCAGGCSNVSQLQIRTGITQARSTALPWHLNRPTLTVNLGVAWLCTHSPHMHRGLPSYSQ